MTDIKNTSKMTMGERILILRKRAGFSRAELAEAMGVSSATIANYEKDKTVPDIKRVAAMSVVLNTSMNMILHGCEPENDEAKLTAPLV